MALARQGFKEIAAVLEEQPQGRQFVVGDRATVADFVMAYTLDWGGEARLLDEFPVLRRYIERMYARPKAPQRIAEAQATRRAQGAPAAQGARRSREGRGSRGDRGGQGTRGTRIKI